MAEKSAVSFVLYANLPFIKEQSPDFAFQETPLFETISDTFIPLLEMFDKLEAAHIPFRIALVIPPIVCGLLADEAFIDRYLHYVDCRIAFGNCEISRLKDEPDAQTLARQILNETVDKRVLFTERYRKNILRVLLVHQQRGRVELLGTTATPAFLPFYISMPQVIGAQIETALLSNRRFFNSPLDGFWLPELGYCRSLDKILRTYGFSWTIVETHAALAASPKPMYGVFYPMATPAGVTILAKDFFAYDEIMNVTGNYPASSCFRSYFDDSGYDLPACDLKNILPTNGIRAPTGYKYHSTGAPGQPKTIYNREAGHKAVLEKAHTFVQNRINALKTAGGIIGKSAICLCAYNADFFGRFWYEGFAFLEEVFRYGAACGEMQFATPSEYISELDPNSFQTVSPGFSSQGYNGYGETYLDSSNDWAYRHLLRSGERMVEIAERFDHEAGVRERVLNQAAREFLLAQSSDWFKMMSSREYHLTRAWSDYARKRLELHLRNFTTFYEALGSDYVSTRFLTELENTNNIFPVMNYRVFRGKR